MLSRNHRKLYRGVQLSATMNLPRLLIAVVALCHIRIGQAKRGRTLSTVVNEGNKLEELLDENQINGQPPWEVTYGNDNAFKDDDEIPFGAVRETFKSRIHYLPPNNRRSAPRQTRFRALNYKLPESFNLQDVYLKRCPSFGHIMFQGDCSNCWAVATISMINDRVCMYNTDNHTEEKYYSAKQLTTCVKDGCKGAKFSNAIAYWYKEGLVTGGDYRMDQDDGCLPYPVDPKKMSGARCETKCEDGTSVSKLPRSRGSAMYLIRSRNVTEIMYEIYNFGPVIATFDVYEDFARYYKSGVYVRQSDKKLGYHAAKLYGWGVKNGIPYWLGANSWGTTWGEGGFFKIRRGTNEASIESVIYASVPMEAMSD